MPELTVILTIRTVSYPLNIQLHFTYLVILPRGERNGNALQYSCLENSIDGGAWQATVHGVTKLDMTERLTLSLSIRNWVMITS